MTEPITLPSASPQVTRVSRRWNHYLLLGLVINTVIWSLALIYLRVARPSYVSEWALILPGAGQGVNVSFPNIGQASSSTTSPFGSYSAADPRANYRYIAGSEEVLAAAAASLKMTPEAFDQPRIKLLDNTTIMQFQIKGHTPAEAQKKSYALYDALIQRLNALRVQEVIDRDLGTQASLHAAQAKLKVAQQRLSQFKVSSGLSSSDQVGNLSTNIEQLRRLRVELVAQKQQTEDRLRQLSTTLGLTPQQAAAAFILKSDERFQLSLKDYSTASATLAVLLSKWGPNHPQVVKERAKQQSAQQALLGRSRTLLGYPLSQKALDDLQLNTTDVGSAQESLFRDLVTLRADQRGLAAQVASLDQQIAQLEAQFRSLSAKEFVMDNLKRDVQISETVFASTLAQLDLGKSDIFAAYPLVQLLAVPSLPTEPASPKTLFVLVGAGFSSVLVTGGLVSLWWRRRHLSTLPPISQPLLVSQNEILGKALPPPPPQMSIQSFQLLKP
ncbi:GumC family protein [Neosynechococcus sphagnicola]|uniref:GumC family protein n=1 Tax=Neosynechococcus sphagnicola TaxID=1501145 RepID=UPI0009079B3A|nr:hypothetical protein [Neosynechococcus sphagnicola]